MKSKWSRAWVKSRQPRKQRKYIHNAPLSVKRKFLGVHLSPDLRKKHNTRSMIIRAGDKVKVLRGSFKGTDGVVQKVITKKGVVQVDSVKNMKKDGSKVHKLLNPSNLMIIDLDLKDGVRRKIIERKSSNGGKK